MAILELHNTLEAAYFLTKKQLAEDAAVKLGFLFSQITRKYFMFFLTFLIFENSFHVIHTKRIFMVRNSH